MQKRVISVQRKIANQMQALDVATFGYAKNLRAKQWPAS